MMCQHDAGDYGIAQISGAALLVCGSKILTARINKKSRKVRKE
jgi:hypothetical protein